jgi:histidine decarboxylase
MRICNSTHLARWCAGISQRWKIQTKPVLRTIFSIFYAMAIFCEPAEAENDSKGTKTFRETSSSALSLSKIVKGAVGPFSIHSDGYGNPGASGLGYISVVTLHAGLASRELVIPGQKGEGLDGTVAFDRAEASGAYIGQINLIVASSFSGPNGAIWGFDIAKAADIAKGRPDKLFDVTVSDNSIIPVYSLDPLLDAGSRLFGTRDRPRFPLLPGAHVIAAHKEITALGPTNVWCGLAIAIAEDRKINANVIIELCGEFKAKTIDKTEEQYFHLVRENLAKSVIRVGKNQSVRYSKIFVGVTNEPVPEGSVGYAMATVPYVVLAKGAVPSGGPEKLLEMNISDWEKTLQSGKRARRN